MAKLIVALDCLTLVEINEMVKCTQDFASYFKIGPVSFLRLGLSAIHEVLDLGSKVFLDLKIHEIPKVLQSVVELVDSQGVSLLTVTHCEGSSDSPLPKTENLKFLAVYMLTSSTMSRTDKFFFKWLESVSLYGFSGVVCPLSLAKDVKAFNSKLLVVCPGLRFSRFSSNHHQVFRPCDVDGSIVDYVVSGHEIARSDHPWETAKGIARAISGFNYR